MSGLQLKEEQLHVVPVGMRAHFRLALETWRRLRWSAYLRNERRQIRGDLIKSYEDLIDAKARALKTTGVFKTEHESLEAAIVHLAYAIEDYRDGV
jgi:hypothetical protein